MAIRAGWNSKTPAAHTPYLLSVNGVACDTTRPSVELATLPYVVTTAGPLVVGATVADDVAVRKVVFSLDGVVVGEDRTAPYAYPVALSEASNGRHTLSATAFDPSGNQATASRRVLVAIDNRFLGTAVATTTDYEDVLTYFNQLTPANAGQVGVGRNGPRHDGVERARRSV
jgi:endo-1,4-beta-xylanase